MFLDVIDGEPCEFISATCTTKSEDESNLQANRIKLILEFQHELSPENLTYFYVQPG